MHEMPFSGRSCDLVGPPHGTRNNAARRLTSPAAEESPVAVRSRRSAANSRPASIAVVKAGTAFSRRANRPGGPLTRPRLRRHTPLSRRRDILRPFNEIARRAAGWREDAASHAFCAGLENDRMDAGPHLPVSVSDVGPRRRLKRRRLPLAGAPCKTDRLLTAPRRASGLVATSVCGPDGRGHLFIPRRSRHIVASVAKCFVAASEIVANAKWLTKPDTPFDAKLAGLLQAGGLRPLPSAIGHAAALPRARHVVAGAAIPRAAVRKEDAVGRPSRRF